MNTIILVIGWAVLIIILLGALVVLDDRRHLRRLRRMRKEADRRRDAASNPIRNVADFNLWPGMITKLDGAQDRKLREETDRKRQ
jgi:hypothetical protein